MKRALEMANAAVMILLTQVSLAWADDPVVQLSTPTYDGTGCPSGTVSATLSPDATALSLIFDKFSVETGKGASNMPVDQKSCTFQVPMTVPAGYAVTVMRVDYRGYHSLPAGSVATFRSSFGFLDGARDHRLGNNLLQLFRGPTDGDFLFSQNATFSEWSACGGSVQLRLNTALGLQGSPRGELATVSIDSADMTGERQLQYVLAWRKCDGTVLRPGQPGHPVGPLGPGHPIGPHGGPHGDGRPGLGGHGPDQMSGRGAPDRGGMGRGGPIRR
ncbi:MAG: DUF4360 domain-containing protein [Bdellovibrionia bacterium]